MMKRTPRAFRIAFALFLSIATLCSSAPAVSLAEDELNPRELKQELAKRRKAVRPSDHEARLELLEWMVEHALYKDALSTFNKVLAHSPDEPRALDLLSTVSYQSPLPIKGPYETLDKERLVRLLHYAGSSVPTVQEYVVKLLRDYQDQELLHGSLNQLLSAGLERPRAFATLALRRLYPGEDQRALLRRAVLDQSKKVRTGAALALAKVEEPGILVPVIRSMGSKSKHVQMFAAEAIGNMGHAEGIEPLMFALSSLNSAQSGSSGVPPAANIMIGSQVAYVSDFDIEIAQGSSIADPQISTIGSGALFTARSLGISGYSIIQHRKTIMRSLRNLSGEDAGKRPKDWAKWWKARQAAQADLVK